MARILYCNGMKEPVGIEGRTAELSWEILEEWVAQKAYRITVEKDGEMVYDSGVLSGKQVRHTIPALLESYSDYGWKLWWMLENGETGEETAHFSPGCTQRTNGSGFYHRRYAFKEKRVDRKNRWKKPYCFLQGLVTARRISMETRLRMQYFFHLIRYMRRRWNIRLRM